ncbi:Transcription initiation protein spt3 [Nowakowskiella sp. JEL0078]|nr:Transcription initiation protein spt3 [Nowakowskiella sp. JEL0078]
MSDQKKYQSEIAQMMFVAGEVSEPLPETTELVEEIVRSQVIEIIIQAVAHAHKRCSKSVSAEDIIFLIRHDKQKVHRLRVYLTWKEVRKRKDDLGPAGTKGDAEEFVKEAETPRAKKRKVKFTWDIMTSLSDVLSDGEDDEDEVDEEEVEANEELIQRLKHADDNVDNLPLLSKKRKDFAIGVICQVTNSLEFSYYDNKPNNDMIDILGFLACEMVSKLTETALVVKKEWDARAKLEQTINAAATSTQSSELISMRETDGYLFKRLQGEQTPLRASMMMDAFRRLQKSERVVDKFRGGVVRSNLSLI